MKKEIEILWKLEESISDAAAKLSSAEFVGEKKIVDYYLHDPLRPALQPTETGRLTASMRLRVTDAGAYITYKNDHFDGDTWLYSDEHETTVGDPEKARGILRELGLVPLVTVAVLKKYYHAHPYEITLEDVDGLGAYIEVEYMSDDDSRDATSIKRDIRTYIESLGLHLGKEENAGKPELLLRKQSFQ